MALPDEDRHNLDCRLDPDNYACPTASADGSEDYYLVFKEFFDAG